MGRNGDSSDTSTVCYDTVVLQTKLAARPKATNLFWGKHPIKVCIKITWLLSEMLTHGAAVSEREKIMNARQVDVKKKKKNKGKHILAAEEGGQNMS